MFDTYKSYWPLTTNIPKIEADVQCTGEAKYVNDFPHLPDEVYGAFVLAKVVHGKISNIDASRALVRMMMMAKTLKFLMFIHCFLSRHSLETLHFFLQKLFRAQTTSYRLMR